MLDGVRRYARYVRATGKEGGEFVKQAATFFGQDKAFLEPWTLPNVQGKPGDPQRSLVPNRAGFSA